MYEKELASREYYEQLLLTKTGIVTPTAEAVSELLNFPTSIRRSVNTPSSLRSQLEAVQRNKVRFPKDKELTQSEKLFQEQLNETTEKENVIQSGHGS